ncbi:MAG TPA: RNA methyltransferase [Lachnospiraceae bacterium]|nr:RNA methyltransferase [Lachnospiraceae bacterium]
MSQYEFIAPCHFGLEAVLKKEILRLGYNIKKVEDGKITFTGNSDAICRSNIFLRTTERILLKTGNFRATTYDELFEGTKAIPWEQYIPKNGKFWVTKATSIKSKLFSPSDIQSIMKKAMVERMKEKYNINWFPEDGADFPVRVTIMKDEVVIGLDTSGDSLHKRGYRQATVKAPITETLAAALILLTPWNRNRILVDPFCGSGTFPIEAAMIGANIAPGMNRSFTAENWTHLIPKKQWYDAVNEAEEAILRDCDMDIQGYDISHDAVKAAMENARRADVEHIIHFQQRPLKDLSHRKKYGFIITNPPYGERLDRPEEMPALYRDIGEAWRKLDDWSMYLITAYEDAQRYIGKKADKNRKIYNGMMKTYFYQYMGAKPAPHKPSS